MKWLPSSPYHQTLEADPRYTCAKYAARGNSDGKDKYVSFYKPSALAPVQDLSGFQHDVAAAKRAAESHYAAMQRKAA